MFDAIKYQSKDSTFTQNTLGQSKLGLVFAGGGGKGAYQIGVWKALHDLGLDKQITHIAGTSVGGLNAALFALHDLHNAELVWRSITSGAILTISPEKIITYLTKLVIETMQLGVRTTFLVKCKEMLTNMSTEGIFSRQGLEQIIDHHVNLYGVSMSDIAVYLTCWNKRTAKPEYFSVNNQKIECIRQLLLATSAIPGVFDSEEINGEHYFDGGLPLLGDNVPVRPLYDAGVRHIIVVHLGVDSTVQKQNFPGAEFLEITPKKELGGFFSGVLNFTSQSIDEKMSQGYKDAKIVLEPACMNWKKNRRQEKTAMTIFDTNQLTEKFNAEYDALQENIQKPNILLAGATGVGKSSLINMIFGEEVAVTGTGKPVTKTIDVFESKITSVRIFDSKGYELGAEAHKEFYDVVIGLAKNVSSPENQIHLIWYCISCFSDRITDYDLSAIQAFTDAKIPVAVVLTKADNVTEESVQSLRNTLTSYRSISIFETSTRNSEFDQSAQLIEWSAEQLPLALQSAFVKSQKANLTLKWKKAHEMIGVHSIGAAVVGFSPIPFSDAPLLVVNEMALMARLLNLYDLGNIANSVEAGSLQLLLGSLLTKGAKSLIGNLLKFIPGIGTVAGSAINATVATGVTYAFGEAVSAAAYNIWKAKLQGDSEKVVELISRFSDTVLSNIEQNIKHEKKTAEDYKEGDCLSE